MVLDCHVWFNDLVNAVVQSRVLGILVLLAPFLARLPDACRLVMMLTERTPEHAHQAGCFLGLAGRLSSDEKLNLHPEGCFGAGLSRGKRGSVELSLRCVESVMWWVCVVQGVFSTRRVECQVCVVCGVRCVWCVVSGLCGTWRAWCLG